MHFQFAIEFYLVKMLGTMKEKKNPKSNMIDPDLFQWFTVEIICMLIFF